ncbi:MAG: cyclic nucleotide-binding domain-containing protein [Pirellulales bacterium]|nr:cyclic nucleotide-binding domain-containing protein [Pirellulales bacterium]
MEVAVARPQRWDQPFGAGLRETDVEHLLEVEPFRRIDPTAFPPSLPLSEILRNDCRLVRCQPGDVVVREGDYGHSAFAVLRGQVRVIVAGLGKALLERTPPPAPNWRSLLAAAWRRPRLPEMRDSPGISPNDVRLRRSADDASAPLRVFVQDLPRILQGTNSVVLGVGEMFGELAALTRSQRTATVIAEDDAVLLEIRWQGLRDLMRRTDELRRHVERLYRENSLRVHLRETPLLADLSPEQLERVADATAFETHGEFDWQSTYQATVARRFGDAIVDEPLIAEEGLPCDGLILIRNGFARQSRSYGAGHRTTAYLGRGQAFGLGEALETAAGLPTAWDSSLRALGYVDVLRIPASALAQLVLPFVSSARVETLLAEAQQNRRAASWTATPAERVDQGLLELLVDRRLVNGQHAMLIDLDRCTRCDDCVRACAATHDNNPRFVRQGVRQGPFMAANACMHCVDPVCMIGCPTAAIHRDPATGVVRIDDPTCIGCATCANSCPYENIRMVEIRDRRGALYTDEQTGQPLAKATKCDLCTGLPGGPACQRACPHDALLRLDLGNLGELSRWASR